MKKTLIIRTAPVVRINSALAAAIVGITIGLRPELYVWTTEPTDPTQGDFYYVHNDDLREALTVRDGITAASAWFEYLPLGRVTSVECVCCELIDSAVETVRT